MKSWNFEHTTRPDNRMPSGHRTSWITVPTISVCLLYLTTFVFIFPKMYREKVYSVYHHLDDRDQDMVMKAVQKNNRRLQQAKTYLNSLLVEENMDPDSSKTRHAPVGSGALDIVIGIITVERSAEKERRVRLGYPSQAAAAFHKLAQQDKAFGKKYIFICNVDKNGNGYRELKQWSSIVDLVVKYDGKNVSWNNREPWELFEKEKQDYQYCLQQSQAYETSYFILVEDDVLPKENFFDNVYKALVEIEGVHQDDGRAANSFGYLKLYYPEKWAGYGSETRHYLELLLISFLGGLSFYALWMLYTTSVRRSTSNRQGTMSHIAAYLSGAMYMVLVVVTTGRPYIIAYLGDTWNWYWTITAKGCCTQCTLYPSMVVPRLVQYLDLTECDIDHPIDLAVETFGWQYNLESYLVEPNLVTHIGMFSSLRSYSKRAAEFI